MNDERQRLYDLIRERALQFGSFTLASGQTSSYYFDGKQVTLHGEGLRLLARLLLRALDPRVEAVGGMSIGADPITGALLAEAAAQGRVLLGFMVRKERKERGTGRQVEGPLRDGLCVAMLEDVVTTGGSTLKAIEKAREGGLKVARVCVLVDRLEGGREAVEKEAPLSALFTREDFR